MLIAERYLIVLSNLARSSGLRSKSLYAFNNIFSYGFVLKEFCIYRLTDKLIDIIFAQTNLFKMFAAHFYFGKDIFVA